MKDGDDDDGYERALRPDQVRRFAGFLSALTPADLERSYDAARMTELEIYPDVIWSRSTSPEDNPLEWLLKWLRGGSILRQARGRIR